MTDYQKLGSMIFKILGITISSFGLMSICVNLVFFLGYYVITESPNITEVGFGFITIIATGFFLFLMSDKLSKWICLKLDKNEKQ